MRDEGRRTRDEGGEARRDTGEERISDRKKKMKITVIQLRRKLSIVGVKALDLATPKALHRRLFE